MTQLPFPNLVTTPADLEELVIDPENFVKSRNLDGENSARMLEIARNVGNALKKSPKSLVDMSAAYGSNYDALKAAMLGSGLAAEGFTDKYSDSFTDNYSNSNGMVLYDTLGLDVTTIGQ